MRFFFPCSASGVFSLWSLLCKSTSTQQHGGDDCCAVKVFGCLTLSFIYFFQTRDKCLDQRVGDMHFQVKLNPGQQWLDWLWKTLSGKNGIFLWQAAAVNPLRTTMAVMCTWTRVVFTWPVVVECSFLSFFSGVGRWGGWGLPVTSSCPHSHFPVTVTTPGEQTQVKKIKVDQTSGQHGGGRPEDNIFFFFINIIVVSGVLSQRLLFEQKACSFRIT